MSRQDETASHKQLHHIVSDHLRGAILEGTYKPGEWLRQKRIARELDVSQMPVREALKELAAEGLVEHIPYRGMRVIQFSRQDVADLYANRSCLEGMAAKSAAENITAKELREIRIVWEKLKENLAPDQLGEYRRLNRQFHQLIYNASQRDYLTRMLNQLWSMFPMMLLSNFPETASQALPQRDDIDSKEHGAILAALERGDGEEAEKLMKEHIEAACREFLSALDAQV